MTVSLPVNESLQVEWAVRLIVVNGKFMSDITTK